MAPRLSALQACGVAALRGPETRPVTGVRASSSREAKQQATAAAAAQPAGRWLGRCFRVRVEYFAGSSSPEPQGAFSIGRKERSGASPKLELGRYARCAAAIQTAVLKHFDGEVPAYLAPVEQPYALEVLLEPQPSTGEPPPEAAPAFSKLASRAWPRVEDVLAALRALCRLPVSLALRRAPDGEGGTRAPGAGRPTEAAWEEDDHGERQPELHVRPCSRAEAVPAEGTGVLADAELRIRHAASGTTLQVRTDEAGVAQAVLFPGHFLLGLCTECGVDELSPRGLRLPCAFEARSATLVARPLRRCSLALLDQCGRPLANLPLCVAVRGPAAGHSAYKLSLVTDSRGCCHFDVSEGEYAVVGTGRTDVPVTEPFDHPITVRGDVAQHFRHFELTIKRIRFMVEVRLCMQSGGPVPGCSFSIRRDGEEVAAGRTNEAGVAAAELVVGRHELSFDPGGSALDSSAVGLVLEPEGTWAPRKVELKTKMVDVIIFFATADGLPAEHCKCSLEHVSSASSRRSIGQLPQRVDSGDAGAATASLALFESYRAVLPETEAPEYEPEALHFTPAGGSQTLVVRRTLLGRVAERRFALALHAGSAELRAQLPSVAAGVRNALLQPQLHLTSADGPPQFNVIAYAEEVLSWRPAPAALSREAAEAAAAFCAGLPRGAGAEPRLALEAALQDPELESVFFITGESHHMDDLFAKRVKLAYYRHQKRPRIHVVLINGTPGRACWKHLQALALLSAGAFRNVCLAPAAEPQAAGLQVRFVSESPDELRHQHLGWEGIA